MKIISGVAAIFSIFLLFSCANIFPKSKQKYFTPAQEAMILISSTNTPMRVFIINNYHDSILLRTKSAHIAPVKLENQTLQHFAQRLEYTMVSEMGLGIAAPQVGILKQIICVQRFDKEGFPIETCINPKITRYSIEKQDCKEGCLSIPGRSDTTKIRALTIDLVYQKLNGRHVKETVTGFTAVIFQHEIDHLNGILYIDHLQEEITYKKH